jgi:hypothetical protein
MHRKKRIEKGKCRNGIQKKHNAALGKARARASKKKKTNWLSETLRRG